MRKNRWKWEFAGNGWADYICPECGYRHNVDVHIRIDWAYCPKCGALLNEYGYEYDYDIIVVSHNRKTNTINKQKLGSSSSFFEAKKMLFEQVRMRESKGTIARGNFDTTDGAFYYFDRDGSIQYYLYWIRKGSPAEKMIEETQKQTDKSIDSARETQSDIEDLLRLL